MTLHGDQGPVPPTEDVAPDALPPSPPTSCFANIVQIILLIFKY